MLLDSDEKEKNVEQLENALFNLKKIENFIQFISNEII
jgi:hypothetical protein